MYGYDSDRSTNSDNEYTRSINAENTRNNSRQRTRDSDDDDGSPSGNNKRHKPMVDGITTSSLIDEDAIANEYKKVQAKAAASNNRVSVAQWTNAQLGAVDTWLHPIPTQFTARLDDLYTSNMVDRKPNVTIAAAYSKTLIGCYMDLCRDVVGTALHPLDALHQMQQYGSKTAFKTALTNLRHVVTRDPHLQQVLGADGMQRLLQQHLHEATATGVSSVSATGTTTDGTTSQDSASALSTAVDNAEPQEEHEATFDDAQDGAAAGVAATTGQPPQQQAATLTDEQWEEQVSRQIAAELAAKEQQRQQALTAARRRRIIDDSDDEVEMEFDTVAAIDKNDKNDDDVVSTSGTVEPSDPTVPNAMNVDQPQATLNIDNETFNEKDKSDTIDSGLSAAKETDMMHNDGKT